MHTVEVWVWLFKDSWWVVRKLQLWRIRALSLARVQYVLVPDQVSAQIWRVPTHEMDV